MSMSGGSTTFLRRVGTDANDTNVILVRQVDRVAASLKLLFGFLLAFHVVVVVCALARALVPQESEESILWIFDLIVSGLGIAVSALGVLTMQGASDVQPHDATRLLYSVAGFGALYTLYAIIWGIAQFADLATYLQRQYHFSEISAMTAVSLCIVFVAYIMAYLSLKTYIFHSLISELKNVDPRARFAATLGKILDR